MMYPGQLKGCQCNGHMSQKGNGECNSVANCGSWCYVDDDAQCMDTFPSLNGEPYRWTCEACSNNNAGRIHHSLVHLVLALSGFLNTKLIFNENYRVLSLSHKYEPLCFSCMASLFQDVCVKVLCPNQVSQNYDLFSIYQNIFKQKIVHSCKLAFP